MNVLVTGAAGFIGSHVVDRLLADGHRVRGVDCFTSYYDPRTKLDNLAAALAVPEFELRTDDLATADLVPLLAGMDAVVHLAGQPGVRSSWTNFDLHLRDNVMTTQRLLETAADLGSLQRFVVASSSSVYGDALVVPTPEHHPLAPVSPYGASKVAAESLCSVYATSHALPTVALRYFTVYGPRQRPDMAIGRLLAAALGQSRFELLGDGSQIRSFTYVADAVDATVAALHADLEPGTVLNVCDPRAVSLSRLVDLVGVVAGNPVAIDRRPAVPGDVARTGGSDARARELLGWGAATPLGAGLEAQLAWHLERHTAPAPS